MSAIVNKGVRPRRRVPCRLLHVDGSDFAIARKDLIDLFLRRKLGVDLESHEERRVVLVREVLVGKVSHNLRSLVIVRKLDLKSKSVDFKWRLLAGVVGTTGAAYELEADEGIGLLR